MKAALLLLSFIVAPPHPPPLDTCKVVSRRTRGQRLYGSIEGKDVTGCLAAGRQAGKQAEKSRGIDPFVRFLRDLKTKNKSRHTSHDESKNSPSSRLRLLQSCRFVVIVAAASGAAVPMGSPIKWSILMTGAASPIIS